MKKQIFAGAAASLALAAMPVAGVFATSITPVEVTDTLTLNIDVACTLVRTGGSSSLTAAPKIGEVATIGTSTFTVDCNNASGYKVSATFGTFGSGTSAINYSATIPTAEDNTTAGTWTAIVGSNTTGIAATNGTLMTANAPTADSNAQSATVTYKVRINDNQAAGAYTTTAVYRLSDPS